MVQYFSTADKIDKLMRTINPLREQRMLFVLHAMSSVVNKLKGVSRI
jgi:hypothetical protein